jgi:hypothetical protein
MLTNNVARQSTAMGSSQQKDGDGCDLHGFKDFFSTGVLQTDWGLAQGAASLSRVNNLALPP